LAGFQKPVTRMLKVRHNRKNDGVHEAVVSESRDPTACPLPWPPAIHYSPQARVLKAAEARWYTPRLPQIADPDLRGDSPGYHKHLTWKTHAEGQNLR
jgi:hypothetical protein